MATNETEIKIKITGEDDASPTLKAAIDKLNQSIGTLTQVQLASSSAAHVSKEKHEELKVGLINVTAAFELVKGAAEIAHKVFEVLEHQLERAIEEALEFEKANNRLTGALVSTGQYTEELVAELGEYAESVEKAAGVNGELVKNMISTGVQMGLSVEKAKQMEEAARKLAAATGKDVNEAFSLLQRSLAGQSRGLALVLPQIKEFGEAQLKQGAAIDVVSKSLDAQYKLYQQSLPAALDRARTSIDNVYKAFGLIITQSELSKMAVNAFTAAMEGLEHGIKAADEWLTKNKETIYQVVGAIGKVIEVAAILVAGYVAIQGAAIALGVVMTAVAGGFTLAGVAAGAFGAVMAVLTSPITLTIAAVVGLTAAFYKWPGLFDIIIGSMKTLLSVALMPLTATIGGLTIAIGASAKALGADWGKSVEDAGKNLIELNTTLFQSGIEQVKYGAASISTGQQVQKTSKDNTDELKKELAANSALNAVAAQRGKMYAGFDIGTEKQREALRGQVQDRDKDLKDFNDYLDAKKRLAISKQEEQQMELSKVQANTLKGSGGSAEKQATSNVAVDAEIRKQAELDALYQKGLLDRQQYDEATLASDQRAAQAELEFKLASKQEMADLLGDSEEGYAAKAALDEERWQLEMQNKIQRAQEEDASDLQIKTIREQAEMDHQARVNQIRQDQLNADIKRNELLNNNWAVTLGKIRLEQEKHGKILGTIRGIQASEEYRGAQQMLTDLSSLRNSHSKKAFEVGKAAATAQATVNTFMAATAAYASLAAIPIVGPVLGAAAAAAAIAAGFVNIQNIQAQKFSGGQADEGMDSIPGSLAGKSFILSQGERVVQPSANRDLKDFLANEKNGGGGGGTNYNITLNYGGSGSRDDASKMADIVIEEIRSRSERGAPIMNEKGLTRT